MDTITSNADAGASDGSASDAANGGDAADTTPPTILATDPADGTQGFSPDGQVTVTFSEAMATASITSTTVLVTGGGSAVAGAVTYADGSATFAPASQLALDTTYTATVTSGATDLAGNPLAATATWTFKTAAVAPVGPKPVLLHTAANYVILAKSAISNVPTSAITGNVALSPAAASYITGFAMTRAGTFWTSPQVAGKLFAADNDSPTPSTLTVAVGDMQAAYTDAAGRPTPDHVDLGSGSIGGATLPPGLYKWGSTVTVPGDVVLSGGANDVWIFQISGDLTMSANKAIRIIGGGLPRNVFWQVAGLVDLGTGAHAEGQVLSMTSITLGTGASVRGRLYAQTAVSLASSTVGMPTL